MLQSATRTDKPAARRRICKILGLGLVLLGLALALPAGASTFNSTGGGRSIQSSGSSAQLWDVALTDATYGWVVGGGGHGDALDGTITAATSGGTTWRAQTSGSGERRNDVVFNDPTHSWAVDDAASILATTNECFPPVAPGPAKAMTAFSLQGLTPPVIGAINEAARTLALTVPPDTSRTAVVADASTLNYMVTGAGLSIGDAYGGGIVAYLLQSGDPGYDANVQHGLIAATFDQTSSGSGIIWALPGYQATGVPGGTGTAIGTGAANTNAIIAQNGAGSTYAAGRARAYKGGGHSDWYLPSKDELNKMLLSKASIGGFVSAFYWSSSEVEDRADAAWTQYFGAGTGRSGQWGGKDVAARVRAIRSF